MNHLPCPFAQLHQYNISPGMIEILFLSRFLSAVTKKEERTMGGLFGVVARDDCVKEIEGREDTTMAEYLIPGSQKFSQTTLPVCGL
jgi:hypothetical protein